MFTQRELELIFYFYHTVSQREVAEVLNLSHRTVDNKLRGIDEKMGVFNQEGFKKYVEERGLNKVIPDHLLTSSIKLID